MSLTKVKHQSLWLCILFAASCKNYDLASVTDTVQPAPSPPATSDVIDVGPNIPPQGRSAFDFLIAGQTQPGKASTVPFPFENLLTLLANETHDDPAVVLIPRGRSLQREAAKPDYFKFPRVLVTPKFGLVEKLPVAEKLFIGYAESAKALEVISFNEIMGRFEFQIVKDYDAPPKVPKVYYADRSLCLACHQGGGPIFPQAPWNETSANARVSNLIIRDRGSDFHGLTISSETGQAEVIDFDELVGAANSIQTLTRLWNDGCDGDLTSRSRCRAAILIEFFCGWGQIHSFGRCSEAGELVRNKIARSGLTRRSSGFPPIPLPAFGDIRRALLDFEPRGVHSPLTLRRAIPLSRGDETRVGSTGFLPYADVKHFWSLIPGRSRGSIHDEAEVRPITDAIDRLAAKSIQGESRALDAPYRRDILLAALSREMGDPNPPELFDPSRYQNLPPAEVEPLPSSSQDLSGDPFLVPFKLYCRRCHNDGPTPPPFMAGSDREIYNAMSQEGWPDKILRLIDWVDDATARMPPSSSAEYRRLSTSENSLERMKMVLLMQKLKDERAATTAQ